jgi:hypothetical protein
MDNSFHVEGDTFIPEVIFDQSEDTLCFNFSDDNINPPPFYFCFFEPLLDNIKRLNISEQKEIKIYFNKPKDVLNSFENTRKVLASLNNLPNQQFIHLIFGDDK